MSAEVARRKLADPADGPWWMTLGAAEREARSLLLGCDDATRTLVEPMLLHLAAETARCGRLVG